jgi:hypothetical protein
MAGWASDGDESVNAEAGVANSDSVVKPATAPRRANVTEPIALSSTFVLRGCFHAAGLLICDNRRQAVLFRLAEAMEFFGWTEPEPAVGR